MQKEESGNLTDVVYNVLYDRIVHFSLPPGTAVSDFTFSKELGVSRTPVREAILKLVDDGLIEKKDKGYNVTDITPDDVRDLYEAREELETSLLSLAMKKGINKESISHLRQINESLKDSVDKNDILQALEFDNKFHEYLAGLSHNERLKNFYDKLAKQIARMMVFSIAQETQRAKDEHELVLQSIENNDIETASEALRENISRAKKQHIDVLENKLKDGWIGIVRFVYKN